MRLPRLCWRKPDSEERRNGDKVTGKQKIIRRNLSILIIAVIILTYIVVQATRINDTEYETQVVTAEKAYDTIETEIFAVRDEEPVKGVAGATVVPLIEDGSRVAKGEGVLAIFSDKDSADRYYRMNATESELKRLEKIASHRGSYAVDINAMNGNIYKDVMNLENNVDSRRLTAVKEDIYDIRDDFLTKHVAIGSKVNLEGEINTLQSKLESIKNGGTDHNTVKAESSGYYVSRSDGYENSVKYDYVTSLTVPDIENIMKKKPSPVPEDVVGEIIKQFDWYMLCVIDKNKAGELEEGKNITVNLPYSAVSSVPATVAAVNNQPSSKLTAVILKSNRMNSYIASLRKEQAELVLGTYNGLRVDARAIQVNDKGEKGVYVKEGNMARFKKIDIIYSTKDYFLSNPNPYTKDEDGKEVEADKRDYVALYDRVIIGGKNLKDGKIIG